MLKSNVNLDQLAGILHAVQGNISGQEIEAAFYCQSSVYADLPVRCACNFRHSRKLGHLREGFCQLSIERLFFFLNFNKPIEVFIMN